MNDSRENKVHLRCYFFTCRDNNSDWIAVYVWSQWTSRWLFWFFLRSNVHGSLWSHSCKDEHWCKEESTQDMRALISVHIWYRSHRTSRYWRGHKRLSEMVAQNETESSRWRSGITLIHGLNIASSPPTPTHPQSPTPRFVNVSSQTTVNIQVDAALRVFSFPSMQTQYLLRDQNLLPGNNKCQLPPQILRTHKISKA